ncbi:MAG: hydrogenase subunit [Candidatus Altiarchaeota archaeon]
MIDTLFLAGLIKALLALVLITGAFIVTRRDLLSLVLTYRIQSILLTVLALVLYGVHASDVLIYLAALTFMSKVVVIPYAVKSVQKRMNIRRDLEFAYLSPSGSMLATIAMILLVYYSFSGFLRELSLSGLTYMGSVFGISLALMGMLVILTRRKVITKVIGYLTMENGVLLFGIFMTELPFIIEVLIIVDLIILVLIATILSTGIDGSIEEFQNRLARLHVKREED